MKTKLYLLLTLAAVAFTIACGDAATTNTAKTTEANAAPSNPAKAETKPPTLKQSTPAEAGESFFSTLRSKDKAAFKSLMSKDSMEIFEAAADVKKMTVDELLDKEFFKNTQAPERYEQRNEKLSGDKATIEIKDEKGEWEPMTFVKEGGVWKITLE